MDFDSYVGIDWSGDKNNFQKGISIALCEKGSAVPKLLDLIHDIGLEVCY